MELLNENVAYLSNYEVLNILKGIKKGNKNQKPGNQLATITYQTVRYLEDSCCKNQTPEKIKEFLKALEPFKLTKCEKLALLNLQPRTALEIQLIVEDSEDRLNEKEIDWLLQTVESHLSDPSQEASQSEKMEDGS